MARKVEGYSLPLAALAVGACTGGVLLLLYAFGVVVSGHVLVRMLAGWGGVMLLSVTTGLFIDFGPKRKQDG